MAVDKKVFSEFYSKKKNDVYYIDDAILDSKAENIFRNDMFCPECKQAQLILVAKTSKHRAYLKRIPSSSHKQECSYNYEYATKKVIQEYVNSLSNAELQDISVTADRNVAKILFFIFLAIPFFFLIFL